MEKKKICTGSCEKCSHRKECDDKSNIILEKVIAEAKKRGYLGSNAKNV